MKALRNLLIFSVVVVVTLLASSMPQGNAFAQASDQDFDLATVSERISELERQILSPWRSPVSSITPSALMRLRNGAGGYLTAASDGSLGVLANAESHTGALWVAEAVPGSHTVFIINVGTGHVLTRDKWLSARAKVVASNNAYFQVAGNKAQHWRVVPRVNSTTAGYQFLALTDGFVLENSGMSLSKGPGLGSGMYALNSIPGSSGYNNPAETTWIPEYVRAASLAKLTITDIKCVNPSTGQDGATKVLFAAIEFAIELGVGALTAGTGATLVSTLKAAAQDGLEHGLKKGLTQGVKEGASYASLFVTRELVKTHAKTMARDKLLKTALLSGGKAATGQSADSLVEYAFNELYGESPDALQIAVGNTLVWPEGGGRDKYKDISSQQSFPVNVEVIFLREDGIKIGLWEHDYGSDDDDLGSFPLDTNELEETISIEGALIRDEDEGSLYEVSFKVEPVFLPDWISEEKMTKERESKVRALWFMKDALEQQRSSWFAGDWRVGWRGKNGEIDRSTTWTNTLVLAPRTFENKNTLAGLQPGQNKYATLRLQGGIDWRSPVLGAAELEVLQASLLKESDGAIFTPTSQGEWRTESYHQEKRLGDRQSREEFTKDDELLLAGGGGRGLYVTYTSLYDNGRQDHPIHSNETPMLVHNEGQETILDGWDNRLGIAGLGNGTWMEKIDSGQANSLGTPISQQEAKDAIVGIWAEVDRSYFEWILTSDNIFIAQAVGGVGTPIYVTGNWSYLGDRRFRVTLNGQEHPELGREFFIHMGPGNEHLSHGFYVKDSSGQPRKMNGYGPDRFVRGNLKSPQVNYAALYPEPQEILENLRISGGLPVPEDERMFNPVSLEDLRKQREANLEAARLAELARVEEQRRQADGWLNRTALQDLKFNTRCGSPERWFQPEADLVTEGGFTRDVAWEWIGDKDRRAGPNSQSKPALLGDWKVGAYGRAGDKQASNSNESPWTFSADGTLAGSIAQKKWTARWTAVSGCAAKAHFDEETARLLGVTTDVQIDIAFHQNGDKEFFIMLPDETLESAVRAYGLNEHEFVKSGTLTRWGTQEIDKSVYSYDFDQILVTRAQSAAQCAGPQTTSGIAGNRPIVLDVSAADKTSVAVYRLDSTPTGASYLDTVGMDSLSRFSGFEGEKFALVDAEGDDLVRQDKDDRCIAVVGTTEIFVSDRTELYRGYEGDYQKGTWRNVWSTTPSAGATRQVWTNVYHQKELSEQQLANGCSGYQTVGSLVSNSPMKRRIWNNGSTKFSVYKVSDTGIYETEPVLRIPAGGFGVLDDFSGRTFAILDDNQNCVAVDKLADDYYGRTGGEIRWTEAIGFTFGDGSRPIEHPDYMSMKQFANGCLDFNKARSDGDLTEQRYARSALLANNGSSTLFAYWTDRGGAWEVTHPVLTIEPGQTAKIADYAGASYTVLDQSKNCAAVVTLSLVTSQKLYALGDGSTPAGGEISDPLSLKVADQTASLSDTQIANGCSLYGRIASTPSSNMWPGRKIINVGTGPLLVHWVSFYGADANGEAARKLLPLKTLEQGESLELNDMSDGDVYTVLDNSGSCVAVIQESDQIKGTGEDANQMFARKGYQLRDNDSGRAFEQEIAQKLLDDKAMQDATDALNNQWTSGQCDSVVNDIQGGWEVGLYGSSGEKLQQDSPWIWRFDGHGVIEGETSNGPFTSQINNWEGCAFKVQIPTLNVPAEVKVIIQQDGSKEFFITQTTLKMWGRTLPNTAPVAESLVVEVDEDSPAVIKLLATDNEGQTLTFSVTSGPTNGMLTETSSGFPNYTPAPGFSGADSFTFVANDGMDDSNEATVSITVFAVNYAPVANPRFTETQDNADRSVRVEEDSSVEITLTGSDADGDALTYKVTTLPEYGSLSGTPPYLTYTPPAGYGDFDDRFSYIVNDGMADSNEATLFITVNGVNDAPVADSQEISVDEGLGGHITLTASDADGDTLRYILLSGPSNGVLLDGERFQPVSPGSDDFSSSPQYSPNEDYSGPDSFTFLVNDGTVDSNEATVSITVNPVNDPPVADNQEAFVDEGSWAAITLTGSDMDGDALEYVVTSNPTGGTLSGVAPNLEYTPGSGFVSDSFTFLVSDGLVTSDEATVSITINLGNQAAVAQDSEVSVNEDSPGGFAIPATDREGDALTSWVTSGPFNGTLEQTGEISNSWVNYTPNPDFYGTDSLTFVANDGHGDSNEATVTITVVPVNDAPFADDQSISVDEGSYVEITLNVTDVENDELNYYADQPANGTLSGSGAYLTYTPNAGFNGSDSFTFNADDGALNSNTATVRVIVNSVESSPTAPDQSVWVDEDAWVEITLAATDPDGDALEYFITANPSSGNLGHAGGAVYTYTPNADFYGSDSFTFVASDGTTDSATATVSITIEGINDPPVAYDQALTTPGNTAVNFTVTADDTDGDPLNYQVDQPSGGTLTGTGPDFTYTPYTDFAGDDSFMFTAGDYSVFSNGATVTITVEAVQDERANKDYSLVPAEAEQACSAQFPNSPADDRSFYNCMDIALESASQSVGESAELTAARAYCRARVETDAANRKCVQEQMGPNWVDPRN